MLLLQDRWTALHNACYYGNTEVAEILLMNNADISATNKVNALIANLHMYVNNTITIIQK